MADSHHSLSLTQTSERSPHIFVDVSGSPLSVYIDVNPEIIARPRLTRLLRASGADISHNLSAATILLVNPETESGLKLVHDWREDSHKAVLDYEWIQGCLQTRRALLESDNWGGFRVEHASECMYCNGEGDEDLEEDDVQSGTPSKASRHSTRLKSSSQGVKASFTHRLPASSSHIAPSSPQPASTQHTPKHRHSTPTIRHHRLSQLTSSQQGSAPSPSPFPQTINTPLLPQAPGPSVLQNLPLTPNYVGSQHSIPAGVDLLHALNCAFQIQNTASQVQSAASQTLTQLVETVIAVAQGQGMDTALIQNFLATLPMSSSVAQQPPPSTEQEPILHSVDEHPGSSFSDSPLRDRNKSSGSTHAPRRVSPEPSLPAKRRRKSLDSPFPAKRVAPDTQQSLSVASPEPLHSERGVFSTKNGRPLLVFVQIDTRGRHEIVHQIKKNGGKITPDIPKAAFVILNPRSVTYTDLRQEAVDSGRTIVQASFITESIKEGRLLDPNDFCPGDAGSPRKLPSGGRRPTSVRKKHSPPESEHATSEAQTSDTVVDASTSMPIRERSITPKPPPPVQSKSGYKFTPAEMTYAWALVRRTISKDPMANKSMVMRALHKKMPHHPESSWLSTISRQRDMYEAVRTEALGLALNPGAHPPDLQQQRGSHHPQNEISDVDMDVGRNTEELEELQVGASLILTEGEPVRDDGRQSPLEGENEDTHKCDDAYARDFEAIVKFLTSADADFGGQDGAEIFRRLTAKSTCITAPSWPEFLDRHAKAVEQEVERRYTTQQTIESAVDP